MALREIKKHYYFRLFDETAVRLREIGHNNMTRGIEMAVARYTDPTVTAGEVLTDLTGRDMVRARVMVKLARIVLLMRWQEAGRLEGLDHQGIADLFRDPPSRSSISRDLQEIERIREIIKMIDIEVE